MRKELLRGFTLIELLIVIAIIGILSSIVLVSLSSARTKSKTAAIQAEAKQLANLFALEYTETGSYNNLLVNAWVPASYTCNDIPVTGNYATEYREVCNSIMNRLGSNATSYNWLVGNGGVNGTFSVMVKTTSDASTGGQYYCVGSSGRTYSGTYNASAPGCYYDP